MARPRPTAAIAKDVDAALADRSLDDARLRDALEALASEPGFRGATPRFGPALYQRNRVLFRPFVLANFGSFEIKSNGWARAIPWSGEVGRRLDGWLDEVDRADDVELFRALWAWKHGPRAEAKWREEVVRRCVSARSPAERVTLRLKYALGYALDEPAALALVRDDPAAVDFVVDHAHRRFGIFGGERPDPWPTMIAELLASGREEAAMRLYRRRATEAEWRRDLLRLSDEVRDAGELGRRLEAHHPEPDFGFDVPAALLELFRRRGGDVAPYVRKHLRRHRGQRPIVRLAGEAYAKGVLPVWAAAVRVLAPDDYNREITRLLHDPALADAEAAGRIALLAGLGREWSFAGFGLAAVQPLEDRVALALYERFPALVRGPFRAQLVAGWMAAYPRLVERVIEREDEELLDFLASRFATRVVSPHAPRELAETVELLSAVYEGLARDEVRFAERAASVVSRVPAYAVFGFDELLRTNRLARLLFRRSASDLLASPRGVRDLLEGSSIHAQVLAFEALGLDDPRARRLATECLDLLLPTLLRPLHRRTRILALRALENAATDADVAGQIVTRARAALALPDHRYPKEALLGLIGRLLHRFPVLRRPAEIPVVHREART